MLKHPLPSSPIRGTHMSRQIVLHLRCWGLRRIRRDVTSDMTVEALAAEMVAYIERDLDPAFLTDEVVRGRDRDLAISHDELVDKIAPWAARECIQAYDPGYVEERRQWGRKSLSARRPRQATWHHQHLAGIEDRSAAEQAELLQCSTATAYRLRADRLAWLAQEAARPRVTADESDARIEALVGVA